MMLDKSAKSPVPKGAGDFRIGEWIVSPSRNEIRRHKERQWRAIEPLLLRFLQALVSNNERTLSKDDLIELAWGGVIVSDEAVSQAASRLRKVLADDPRKPRYISTIRNQGYRIAQPAEEWAHHRRTNIHLAIILAGALVVVASIVILNSQSSPEPRQIIPIATDSRDESRPALSPDGRQLAFVTVDADGFPSIWVSSGKSGDAVQVAETSGMEAPTWLSNRTIAMQMRDQSGCKILAADIGYSGTREIGRCDGSGYADLSASPDGRQLAYNALPSKAQSGPHVIMIRDVGGAVRQMTSPPPGSWGDYDPKFSPDGRSLIFTRATSEGQQDLYLRHRDGREERVTRRFGNIFGSTWSGPTEILYSARSGGRFALRRINLTNQKDEALPLAIADPVNPAVFGDELFFESRRFQQRLVSSIPVRLPNSSGINTHPALSADGSQLAFASDRSGTLELWLFDMKTGKLEQLTHWGRPFIGVPRFAEGQRSIVYEVRDKDDADIYLLNLRTRRSKPLVKGDSFDTAPSISANGRWVYFGSDRGGEWAVYRIPIQGGTIQPVLRDAFAGMESPDGSSLYFTRRSRAGLYRMDWADRSITLVDGAFAIADWGAFIPVREGVLFASRLRPQRSSLILVRKNGSREVVIHPKAFLPSNDPVVSATADLRMIVHVESDNGAGDIFRSELRK